MSVVVLSVPPPSTVTPCPARSAQLRKNQIRKDGNYPTDKELLRERCVDLPVTELSDPDYSKSLVEIVVLHFRFLETSSWWFW